MIIIVFYYSYNVWLASALYPVWRNWSSQPMSASLAVINACLACPSNKSPHWLLAVCLFCQTTTQQQLRVSLPLFHTFLWTYRQLDNQTYICTYMNRCTYLTALVYDFALWVEKLLVLSLYSGIVTPLPYVIAAVTPCRSGVAGHVIHCWLTIFYMVCCCCCWAFWRACPAWKWFTWLQNGRVNPKVGALHSLRMEQRTVLCRDIVYTMVYVADISINIYIYIQNIIFPHSGVNINWKRGANI